MHLLCFGILFLAVFLDSVIRRARMISLSCFFWGTVGCGILWCIVFTDRLPSPFSWLPTLRLEKYWMSHPKVALGVCAALCPIVFLIYLLDTWNETAARTCRRCGKKLALFTRQLDGSSLCEKCSHKQPEDSSSE
jgi:hypothetical protein